MTDQANTGLPVPQGLSSVAARLRESFAEGQANKTREVEIPGYDGLFGVFRAIDDYTEVRPVIARAAKARGDEAQKEISIAAETLLLSSVDTFAMVDGKRVDIGLPLGKGLYDTLWEGDESHVQVDNDRQALSLLIPSTVSLVALAGQVDLWSKQSLDRTGEEILGES